MKSKHWVLTLAICFDVKPIIPVLPAIPHYRTAWIGNYATKREAAAEMARLGRLNPSYMFQIGQEWIGK